MGRLGQILGTEHRSNPTSTIDRNIQPWLVEALGGGRSFTGKNVGVDNALTLIPVYAAVNKLATAVGSISVHAFSKQDGAVTEVVDGNYAEVLTRRANDRQPASELWETVVGHLLLWGNAYLYKERDANGLVKALWPQIPSNVLVGLKDGKKTYELNVNGRTYPGTDREFLHIRNFGTDTILGLSPIAQARNELGVQLAQQEYAGRFYANNASPSGVLQSDGELTKEQGDHLLASWNAAHRGLDNAAKVAVLENGVTWQTIGLPLEDQQFIEQRQLAVQDVARLFNMSPSMLGESDGGNLTYANVEQRSLDFVNWSVRPLVKRLENFIRFDGDLTGDPTMYVKWNFNELVRADIKTRYETYGIGVDTGFLLRSEVRAFEELPAVDGIDDALSTTSAPPVAA